MKRRKVVYLYLDGRLRQLGMNQSDLGYALKLSHTAINNRMIGKTP